ncbi:MAG: AI-2E family transporter [Actinomycetota bacterium]|nr:AI-2E family transporter [Actinomycetota bacterium]
MSDEQSARPGDQPDAPRPEPATEALPASDPHPSPPSIAQRIVVPRWVQLVLLPLSLLGLWALARAAGVVLLIFLVAGVIALILNPLVKLMHRKARLPHGVAVFAVYIGFFLLFAGVVVVLINPVTDQVQRFQRDVPKLVDSANGSLAEVQTSLRREGINVRIKDQGRTALQTLQRGVLKQSGSLVSFGRDILQRVVEGGFAFVLVLVISIYMLVYAESIGRLVRSVMPAGDGSVEDDFALRVQRAVAGYVRGQLIFSVTMGVSAGVALWLFGVVGIFPDGQRYALFFGVFYGLMEAVPFLGPVLGALPPVLVALFGDPVTAIWVVLLVVALQQLEGHIVAPQVFGHSLRINPLIIILALLLGAQLYGILGALVALPVTAILRETVLYLRRHLVFEPWAPATPALAGALPLESTSGRPCPGCGSDVQIGAANCPSCGAPQTPRVGARS